MRQRDEQAAEAGCGVKADDPRHGTYAGHNAHVEHRIPMCDQCRAAGTRYMKRRRMKLQNGERLTVPAHGSQRRIHALMALGWTMTDIAQECGWHDRSSVLQILNPRVGSRGVRATTAAKLTAAYDALSMRLPTLTPARSRVRNLANRRQYAPPLAWEGIDIDDPGAEPYRAPERTPGRPEILPQILEDFDWLTSAGESPEKAAERVGVALSTIRDYRTRLVRREAS